MRDRKQEFEYNKRTGKYNMGEPIQGREERKDSPFGLFIFIVLFASLFWLLFAIGSPI